MSRKFKLEEHLRALLVEDKLCYEEGDWERLNQIRMAIDDTRDELADIEAEWALVMHEAQHNQ
jgi:hypothetical protein